MRIAAVLNRKFFRRLFKASWASRGKIKVIKSSAEDVVKSHGFEVVDIKNILYPPKPKERIECIGLYDKEIPLDENHPNYCTIPCYKYGDTNVLLEGLEQAKILTNTVELHQDLESVLKNYENKFNVSKDVHEEWQKRIKLSCIFEATQELLPRKTDPLRPAWKFARDLGIPDYKKNELLCKNLLTLCEVLCSNTREKSALEDMFFTVPLEAHNKKIQLELMGELVVTSNKRIKPLAEPSVTHNIDLPNIHPIDCTISLNPVNNYVMEDIYPIKIESKWPFINLAFVHYNSSKVKNLFEEEVTENQIFGRTLMKGFCISASQARALYGNNVKELPEPVVIPLLQTDGKKFYFGIYQLNTLEIDKKTQLKNIFWNSPSINLYDVCEYKSGRPVLEGYNPQVIEKVLSMYNIQ